MIENFVSDRIALVA